jgi:hypothetical protein
VRQRYTFNAPRPGHFRQRRPVDIYVAQTMDKIELTASADCDGQTIQQKITLPGPFEPARQPEKSEAALQRCFEKLGETEWRLDTLHYHASNAPIFVPASALNEARRKLMADFTTLWNQSRQPGHIRETFPTRSTTEDLSWSAKTRVIPAIEELDMVDEWIFEMDLSNLTLLEQARAEIPKEKLRLALPPIIHNDEMETCADLIASMPEQQKWEASNIGGLQLLKGKSDITADWALYTLNQQAALQWQDQGICRFVLSPEDDAPNYCGLVEKLGAAAIIPVYQYTPLMISATRPIADDQTLTDRSHNSFRVESSGRESVLVAETPFSLVDHLEELKVYGARNFRIDLSFGFDTTRQMIDTIKEITQEHTAYGHPGNFARTLL